MGTVIKTDGLVQDYGMLAKEFLHNFFFFFLM